jgi:hypothetical protein
MPEDTEENHAVFMFQYHWSVTGQLNVSVKVLVSLARGRGSCRVTLRCCGRVSLFTHGSSTRV